MAFSKLKKICGLINKLDFLTVVVFIQSVRNNGGVHFKRVFNPIFLFCFCLKFHVLLPVLMMEREDTQKLVIRFLYENIIRLKMKW